MINAAERLAKRVRAAMGGHNNDDLPVTQCVINMREEVVSLQAECEKLVEALSTLRGCIMETRGPDAHSALVLADAALSAYRSQGGGQ